MFKKLLSGILLIFLFVTMLNAQDNNGISMLPAPRINNYTTPNFFSPMNFNSRAFGYNAYGTTIALGPFKMWLSMPFGMVSLFTDPSSSNFVQAGSFCGTNGLWYGVRYGTNALVTIDTSTGVITQVGTVTGAGSLTGIGWDFTTNTMYASNYVSGASNCGTLNLTTGVYTPLPGTFTGAGLPIDMAVSNSGTIYVNNITSPSTNSQIYTVNKTTGVWTALPQPSGYNANYAQGMSWDHSVDTGYLSAYNYTTSAGELRRIDAATGVTTLIGALGIECDGFAIPGFPGPQVVHTPLPNTQNLTGPYVVNCQIVPQGSPITYAKIFWSRNNPTVTDSVTMTTNGGNNWTGNIPGNGAAAIYRYYIKGMDASGRVGTHPAGAPAALNTFTATSTDTTKPVITHTPIGDIPKVTWPVTINCTATDPFGISSVIVRWRKNAGSWSTFNLVKGSGNNYSGAFNSDTSQIAVGDSIFYRIIATDSSQQQNKDSTALYGRVIINQVTITVGTGTTSSNFPFTTYWMDGRTQYLFTAADMGNVSGYIQQVGFNVLTASSQVMNGFKISMQNTYLTSLTGFVTTGWVTCYNTPYTVPGTGWQMITLTTPFGYAGASGYNLLIEVCYNNSSYTSYSTVNSSSATGMYWGRYGDLSSGDGCATTTWSSTTAPTTRANTRFVVNPAVIVGIGNNNGIVPNIYSLSQNYPNPFNPVTQISYGIPKQGLVKLTVYDILGREITKLVNEVKPAGTYMVDFDGAKLASGTYFYKLEANEFTSVKKMVLIK